MRTFKMIRGRDETGISGTGEVLKGVVFDSGKVVVEWLGQWLPSGLSSVGFYDNYFAFYEIHVAKHPNNDTEMQFDSGAIKQTRRKAGAKCRHCGNMYEDHPRDFQWNNDNFRRSCAGNLVELET